MTLALPSARTAAVWITGAAIALGSCRGWGGSGGLRAKMTAIIRAEPAEIPSSASPATPGTSVTPAEAVEPVMSREPVAPSADFADDEGVLAGGHLVAPKVIALPYVVAGQGASTATVEIANGGDAPLDDLAWRLTGDDGIALEAAPKALAPGETARLTVTWTGSAVEAIAEAKLTVTVDGEDLDVPVFAVAGDPALGPATWEDVEGAGGVVAGTGVTIAMPAAPYPDGASKYTDASVRIFVPAGYRDRGAQDLVVHFHGWNTTLASTLAQHLYQGHVYASGVNAVLVVPQGPVEAPSGDFGKLMTRGGLARLQTEVLALLYREGKITHPARGDLTITAHSGGYQAAAAALDPANLPPRVTQVGLFDSLYGYASVFEAFALAGNTLRSSYVDSGGTFDENWAMTTYFTQHGVKPAVWRTQRALRDDAPVVGYAWTSHEGITRTEGAYGEDLRWRMRHSRRGPRIELRQVVPEDGDHRGDATARWLSPPDEDLAGFVVETSTDGVAWMTATQVPPTATEATFPLHAGAGVRVRVKGSMLGVPPAEVLPSDTYRVDPHAHILVVDGFDRVLDGAFGGLHHDFAARIGEAAGAVASISHRAVTEDGFDLGRYDAVVWLLGDQATADVSLSAAEQTALRDYVNGGGHLLVSGSELAWDLAQTPGGALFLEECFGAMLFADDAASREVAGHGPLAAIPTFAIGGHGAPYVAASPDALATTPAGSVLLEYGSGAPAAVGLAGKAALVGFPLELADARALPAIVQGLLAFVGGS
jgi:hypothetical protein